MKIGILTYHRAINMGSIVQAYCLQKKLRSDYPNAKVEIIDYRPGWRDFREGTKHLSKRWPFIDQSRWAEISSIRRFGREILDFSPTHLTSYDLARAHRWFEQQDYHAVFVGSDTVWEYRPNSYSPPMLNVFHLPWSLSSKKIAFAASADPVPPGGIQNFEHSRAIANAINSFDVLGIRDDATIKMLRSIGVDTSHAAKVLDPTLHVDFQELASHYQTPRNGLKPLAGVAMPKALAPKIANILHEAGYEVWNWGAAEADWSDGNLDAKLSANEVLGAYRNLSIFVTDRFHGSIFAMRLGRVAPIFVESIEKWHNPNSKGRELFETLGLSDRVIRNDTPNWPKRLAALVQRPVELSVSEVGANPLYDEKVREVLTS